MKSRMLLLGASLISLLLVSPAGWAQQKYSPKTGEELYGTWVDPDSSSEAYRWVISSEGTILEFWKGHEQPYMEARYSIDKKWTDDGGNICYQCTSRWGFQPWSESKVIDTWYTLFKIDASSSSLRSVWSQHTVPADFQGNLQPRNWKRE